jgi:hypothetical protein
MKFQIKIINNLERAIFTVAAHSKTNRKKNYITLLLFTAFFVTTNSVEFHRVQILFKNFFITKVG